MGRGLGLGLALALALALALVALAPWRLLGADAPLSPLLPLAVLSAALVTLAALQLPSRMAWIAPGTGSGVPNPAGVLPPPVVRCRPQKAHAVTTRFMPMPLVVWRGQQLPTLVLERALV